jgi:hypothetical protein
MRITKPRKNLKFILGVAAVQLLVGWMPNFAQAHYPDVGALAMDARFVLATAAKENEHYSLYMNRANAALQTTEVIHLPEGSDYARCREQNIFAYYNPLLNKIHLCAKVLKQSEDRIVQTIIHEAAHAAGFHDECSATRLSVYAMMMARRPNSEVGYSQCPL